MIEYVCCEVWQHQQLKTLLIRSPGRNKPLQHKAKLCTSIYEIIILNNCSLVVLWKRKAYLSDSFLKSNA